MLPERCKLLIVEDNEAERYLYKSYLTATASPFEFVEVATGKEALEIWPVYQPHCVLIDFNLPDMTGLEIISSRRNGSDRLSCAVVMLTGVGDERVAVEAMKTGAMDYVAKTHNIADTLHLTIRNAIEKFGLQQKIADQRFALEESERSYRMLTEAIPQMVWTTNANGVLSFANPRWLAYTGLTLVEAAANPLWWDALLDAEDVGKTRTEWERATASRTIFEIEHRFKREADQAYRWHLSRAIPMISASCDIAKWFGTSTDIDDRIRAEKAVVQKQKLESIGLLAGGIAHDFNNLLCGILGGASYIAEALPKAHHVQPMLGDVIRASERAAQLTRQMLAYAGKGAFVVKRIDLCDLVRDTCNLIRTSIPNTVHLKLQLSHDLPPIETDAGQMQQVIMNIVINAAESIPEGRSGIVVVQNTLREVTERWIDENNLTVNISPGAYLVLEVSDTGRGMDEATKTKMFDPFFTTKFTGRGLGLAAVLGIVVSNRGAIQVSSGLGQGTTIRVLIPAATGHADEIDSAECKRSANPAATGAILVIDDEDAIRNVAKASLERAGFQVLLAGSGAEGLELLERQRDGICLVLLDMSMPGMGGKDVLKRLRAFPFDIPVVICSGHSEQDVSRQFSNLGIRGVIQKPYTTSTLVEKVASFLTLS